MRRFWIESRDYGRQWPLTLTNDTQDGRYSLGSIVWDEEPEHLRDAGCCLTGLENTILTLDEAQHLFNQLWKSGLRYRA